MNPYENLDEKCFWAPSVGKREPADIELLWNPKRNLFKRHKITTYGSCFAQHFSRALVKRGYGWMQTEGAPSGLSEENSKKFNYGVFSSRTGNIYTVGLLRQWTEWAVGISSPPDEVWQKDGRFYDPFRPNIEPDGFATESELLESRQLTIEAFRESFVDTDIFVFTLGLTECWRNTDGYEYPMCPGTIAGEFDEEKHKFHNVKYIRIAHDLKNTIAIMRKYNPKIRVLLTVSPVPLTATMSGDHVLTATMQSKSVLRAIAGDFVANSPVFDYFPSYEIISSAPFQGAFYHDNKRTVKQEGVDFVMASFFDCINAKFNPKRRKSTVVELSSIETNSALNSSENDTACEEELLGAFAPSKEKTRGKRGL